MKTVVYQSYRTENVPRWIERCLVSVREWAADKGFDYRFIDDRLFDYVPDWFRDKVGGNKVMMSDLARLELAREFLGQGYRRTIWVDADVLIFDPARFDIAVDSQYAFCREVWVEQAEGGQARLLSRVNNAVSVFTAGNDMLDFYIHACKSLVGNRREQVSEIANGVVLLTRLYEALRFSLITDVGLFSPLVLNDIAGGGGPMAAAYMEAFGGPVRAGNLCASFRNDTKNGIAMTDELYERAVENLMNSGGAALNDLLVGQGLQVG